MEVWLANPRGFCAGVDRAIEIVERTLEMFGPPIYVRHEVVHNRFVVEGLKRDGAIFVDELAAIPDGATVVFSAHGVAPSVRVEAELRHLRVFDATCPLVTKVHMEVARHCWAGRQVILIGHCGHPEVEGTMGQCRHSGGIYLIETLADVDELPLEPAMSIAFVTQTTLSMDDAAAIIAALQQKFPDIQGPNKSDICYATQNRQNAVRDLAKFCQLVLVVGSPNSSNSNRLRELAEKQGARAFLIDGPMDIQQDWLQGVAIVGVTAGASAPETLVKQVVKKLMEYGANKVIERPGHQEAVVFSLPILLRPSHREE